MAEPTDPNEPSGASSTPDNTPENGGGGPVAERIEELNIERELQDSYLTYAMSTIMDRALPDVRDGLKPSQRRILVAMRDLNLGPRSKHLKCAKIAGNTSGDYHPHGEAIVYPTLVRLGQDWNLRYPLIDPQGNFGSTDGDPPAAMRYTEARPTAVEAELLADLEYDTVDFQPNYDERLEEPTVLPAKFPNLLVNGSTGIAVGMACNLLPHNLREICDAIVHVINNPECDLPSLLQIVQGPDFPTGGVICGRDGIVEGYSTGRGKITLRCKLHVETAKNGRSTIVIDELPYGIIRKSIVESVADCYKNDKIKDISAVNDESGRQHKCRIVIDLKRDADPDIVINQLYQYTPCQITVSMINIALVNRQPRTLGLKELIQHFIEHRREVIVRRTKFLLKRAQQRAHIVEGQIFAVCDIDEVIRLIRESKTREEAIEKLKKRAFRIAPTHPYAPQIPERLLVRARPEGDGVLLSQAQAEAIGRLQLIQLVGLEIEKLVSEYRALVEEIEGYEAILADENLVFDIIREDTLEMKEKYGDDRRTEIAGGVGEFNLDALIQPHDVVVTLSHNGYIKRLPVDTYRSQGRGGRGIKANENREGDFIEHLFVANTHHYLMFFTNKGRVYERRVYDVPEAARTSVGRSIANLLSFQEGEKIASVLAIKDFEAEEQYLIFATAKGFVKKTALKAYANIRTGGIIALDFKDEGDTLIDVSCSSGHDHVMLCTKSGLAVRFEEEEVRPMGRNAAGVTGVRFKREGDEVVSMNVIPAGDNTKLQVLTACVKGYGKRTPLEDYPVKGRGTQGVISIDANDRNGDVVAVRLVEPTDELMMITEKGILIRTRVGEIRETGRNAAGVRLLSLDDGDSLVAMAKVDAEEKVDEAAPESPASPAPTDGEATPPPAAADDTPPADNT
jgi:DNA gyrase subunit A